MSANYCDNCGTPEDPCICEVVEVICGDCLYPINMCDHAKTGE